MEKRIILPRDKIKYELDGKTYQGVTSIIGNYCSQAIVGWAHKIGKQGLNLYDERKKSTDVGHLTHSMIECLIQGIPYGIDSYYTEEARMQSHVCVNSFMKWWKKQPKGTIECEISMIAKQIGYGGTIDILRTGLGGYRIFDIKTSNAIYAATYAQVAAYRELLCRVRDIPRKHISCTIVNCDKEGFINVIDVTEKQIRWGWRLFHALFTAGKMEKNLS